MVPALALLFSLLFLGSAPPDLPTVLVCEGNAAYAYHKYVDCRGLAECEGLIIEMPEDSAKVSRKFCKICKRKGK